MARSRADENKAIRQENLRQQLSAQKHHEHLHDLQRKIEVAESQLEVSKYRASAEISAKLLTKYLPDLKAVEYVDKTPQNITFQFFGEPNIQPKAVQGAVIDANAIEDQSKGSEEIVDTVATESVVVDGDK